MNFDTLREQLRRAREQARVERKGVERVGMTLDEAAAATGLNRATIHSIENIRREPSLKPELETVERMALAYGLTLSSFFARVEGLSEGVVISDNAPPQPEEPDDLPAFYSEERIAKNVLRLLAKLAVEGDERRQAERPANRRLPPATRALAAERRTADREHRRRDVPPAPKKRSPKR